MSRPMPSEKPLFVDSAAGRNLLMASTLRFVSSSPASKKTETQFYCCSPALTASARLPNVFGTNVSARAAF